MTEKEFGKLSREELHDASKSIRSLRGLRQEIRESALEKPDRFAELMRHCGHWPFYYDHPLAHVIGLFFHYLGLLDFLHKVVTSEEPHKKLALACVDNAEVDIAFELASEERQFEVMTVSLGILGHLRALQMYSQPMDRLMARLNAGDDEALFEAVMVDRSVMATKTVALRIARAQLIDDRSFFDRLAKSITRTRPRRPAREYDDLRFIIEVIEEAKSLSTFTYEQLADLLIDDLKLYPNSGADPVSGLSKIIQKRNALYRN